MTERIHVAVGVVADAQGRILIARRPADTHLGGLWEFPGGKLEAGENVEQALRRELAEEVGIWVQACRPLIRLRHDYAERKVLLDVRRVEAYTGTAHGRERQPIAWVEPDALPQYAFPEANRPIVGAARLPERYAILDVQTHDTPTESAIGLERLAALGCRLVQLRAQWLDESTYANLAQTLLRRADALGVSLVLNAPPQLALTLGAAGVHLSARRLMALQQRPLPEKLWVGASCHDAAELAQAQRIAADFAVLSPVQPTASHPGAPALGWACFSSWIEPMCLPVYALGGLTPDDLATAWQCGAQGIAGIRGFSATNRTTAPLAPGISPP